MKKILFYILAMTLVAMPSTAQKKTSVKPKTTATAKKTAQKSKAKPAASNAKKGKARPASVSSLRNEQARIKQNIKRQERALRANKAQVAKKLRDLDRINGDMNRRQQSIDSINHEIRRIDNDINMLNTQLENLNTQLAERKASYIKSMRYMAKKRGIQSQLMFIFSAKNFSEMYRRLRFMREYASFQRTQGKALQEKQAEVNGKREQLHNVKGQKSTVLNKGQRERNALAAQKDEQQKIVNSLQKQQSTIQAVIADQKKKDAALNAQIDRLVAEEVERARQRAVAEARKQAEQAELAKKQAALVAKRKAEAEEKAKENARRIEEAKAAETKAKEAEAKARDKASKERAEQLAKEAEAARIAAERKAAADRKKAEQAVAEAKKESHKVNTLSSADRLVSGGFEANKGRMPSPIAGGRIVSHYGQHGVDGLPGVVLDNKGINILGSAGATVRAIYEGEVSAVFNVGGSMGVLVRHGAYISVYCNLRSVSVSRGQKVSARQGLGTVGTDNILQFQLRKERDKLNPEQWLAR